MYEPCPNSECQGIIAPGCVQVTNWSYESISRNILRKQRIHYIYCETCGTAFELTEEEHRPGWAEYHAYRNFSDVSRIKRKLPAFPSRHRASAVRLAYDPPVGVCHCIGVA